MARQQQAVGAPASSSCTTADQCWQAVALPSVCHKHIFEPFLGQHLSMLAVKSATCGLMQVRSRLQGPQSESAKYVKVPRLAIKRLCLYRSRQELVQLLELKAVSSKAFCSKEGEIIQQRKLAVQIVQAPGGKCEEPLRKAASHAFQ